MDNTTIYEFLQEKSVMPTGPGSYSDSTEISNAIKATEQNSSPKTKGKKDVNFYDYDGTLVDSYSTEEFLQLSAMPANPFHDGLTAQGWNYTLPDAKEYVSDYGKLNIGQMYITDDGKTRIHIRLEEGRLSPGLVLCINGSVDVDWGDNTAHSTMTGSDLATAVRTIHTYATAGDYIIILDVTGEFAFYGADDGSLLLTKYGAAEKVYENSIVKLEIGDNITSIGDDAFNNCFSLTSITIPSSVTTIGDGAFQGCCSLTSITIPSSVTTIGDSAFNNCCSLTSITIPSSVTTIGDGAFNNCFSLTSIAIPSSVTSIGTYAFNNCCSLTSITIPSSVTSIGESAFFCCYSLTSITIPSSVTTIGDGAFYSCEGLGFIKFKRFTPATVSNTSAWNYIPTDCIIYVPQGSLSAYTRNNKYPSSNTYTYVEYDLESGDITGSGDNTGGPSPGK